MADQQQQAQQPLQDAQPMEDDAAPQQQQQEAQGAPPAPPVVAAVGPHGLAQLMQGQLDALAQAQQQIQQQMQHHDDEFDVELDEFEDLEDWEQDGMEEGDVLGPDDSEEDDEEDEEDISEDSFNDDDAEHLSVKQRVQLECGVLHHDAHLTAADTPTRHPGVASAAHHHQTADALAHLPAPTPPEAAAAVAAAAAGQGQEQGVGRDASAAAAAAAAARFVVDALPEDVVVSCKGVLSVYRLQAGQPAKLLARSRTLFRHYSIAASPCGNYIAATGNSGLMSLFKVQRSNSSSNSTGPHTAAARVPVHSSSRAGALQPPAAAQQEVAGSNPAATTGAGLNQAAGSEVDAEELAWQLIHVATLLCKNGPEVMVNSVRFGHFAGRLRMLVAHQDGMLYLFNLPGTEPAEGSRPAAATAPASASPAAAAAATAGGGVRPPANTAVGRAAATASELGLMVQYVPDWEPLGSQVNSRYVEQLLALLPPSQRAAADAVAAAAAKAGAEAGLADVQQQQQQQQQADPAEGQQGGSKSGRDKARREAHPAACDPHHPGPDSAMGQAEGPDVDEGPPTAAPGTLQHTLQAVKLAERVLGVLLSWMQHSGRCPDLQQHSSYINSLCPRYPQPHSGAATTNSHLDPFCRADAYAAKGSAAGHILQNEACLKELQILERHRLSHNSSDDWVTDPDKRQAVESWAAAVDALRAAAGGQWALLGAAGHHKQQQQWQQQQAEGDTERDLAVARAVYLLLLLRLLGPIARPSIYYGARVVVLRHGPQAADRRLTHTEISSAPRLQTCAITRLARDDKAAEAARIALAQANADLNMVLNHPNVLPGLQDAAQIAVDDAARLAAQDQLLPLNIAEASPDGQWLAVGADQLAVVLVPAGAGYKHQICHVLDVCPSMGSRPSAVWHMHQGTLGCQYLSFNSSSTMLAASSDATCLVVVWGVAGPALGQRLAAFSLHNRAVLPVRFMPPYHPLTALQQGVAAAARAAAAAAAEAVAGAVSAEVVLQLQAGAGAVSPAAVAAADVLQEGVTGQLRDRLLAYCELYGGLHLADMSVFIHAGQAVPPHPLLSHPISSHFCIKTFLELSPKRQQQQQQQDPAAADEAPDPSAAPAADDDDAADQQQQEQQQGSAAAAAADDDDDDDGVDAAMAEAQEIDPFQAEAEAFLDAFGPPAAAAAGGGSDEGVNDPPNDGGVGAPAAAVAAAGGSSEDLDVNKAPRINGLVVTPGGRVLVACPTELVEWQLITLWSHTHHNRLPAAFKAAVKTLLLAAAQHHGTMSPAPADSSGSGGSSSSSHQQLLAQVPGPVLEQVIDAAALPQGSWAAAAVPSYSQLCEALEHRPQPPQDEMGFGLGWPEFMAGAQQLAAGLMG